MPNDLLRISTPEEVTKEEEASLRSKVDSEQEEQVISELASHVETHWSLAQTAKRDIEDRLFRCQRQRNGEYEEDEKQLISSHKSSDIFMQLTNVKCRGAEAWISDALLPAGEKPWGLDPTPMPDLQGDDETEVSERLYQEIQAFIEVLGPEAAAMIPPEQLEERMVSIEDEIKKERYEEAKKETNRMEVRLEDELVEGGFYDEFRIFIRHMATFPTAFMKGPVVHAEEQLAWDYETGTVPSVEKVYRRRWKTVSPFDVYPSPGARSLQDGCLIQRHRLRRGELYKYIGAPGFDDDAIRQVLREYDEGKIDNWLSSDQERADIEDRPNDRIEIQAMIDALEFWGPVQGRKLTEWGMDDAVIDDPDKDYQVTVWKIGRYVVMARLNSHPLGHRPYYSASFEDNSDSIWGKSPPELMRDCQRICNATARALINNMGISSGPQVEVFSDRIDASEDAEDIFPWKVWLTKSDEQGSGRPAVHFTQPNINVEPLLIVYDTFFKQASEQSGIPAHVYGSSDIGGAGKTASGLAMLMNAASKTLKDVISHIDDGIIRPVISDLWLHMMLFDTFPKRGDVKVVARASEYLIIAEQIQMRRNEFLMNTNNPVDMQIIGMGGRAELLRESMKSLKLDEGIIPTKEEVDQMMGLGGPMGPQGPQGPSGPQGPGEPAQIAPPNQQGPNEVREMPVRPMEP